MSVGGRAVVCVSGSDVVMGSVPSLGGGPLDTSRLCASSAFRLGAGSALGARPGGVASEAPQMASWNNAGATGSRDISARNFRMCYAGRGNSRMISSMDEHFF